MHFKTEIRSWETTVSGEKLRVPFIIYTVRDLMWSLFAQVNARQPTAPLPKTIEGLQNNLYSRLLRYVAKKKNLVRKSQVARIISRSVSASLLPRQTDRTNLHGIAKLKIEMSQRQSFGQRSIVSIDTETKDETYWRDALWIRVQNISPSLSPENDVHY